MYKHTLLLYIKRERRSVKRFDLFSEREGEKRRSEVTTQHSLAFEREKVFSGGGGDKGQKISERETNRERFSFFPTASLFLRDKLSSKINFLSQII